MPTYQYACRDCDHSFEQVQSFSEDSLTTCPECQGNLRKLFNAVGVVFKGSGFYRNDSRSTTTSTDAPSSTGGSSETKAEKKAESTTPAKSESSSSSSSTTAAAAS